MTTRIRWRNVATATTLLIALILTIAWALSPPSEPVLPPQPAAEQPAPVAPPNHEGGATGHERPRRKRQGSGQRGRERKRGGRRRSANADRAGGVGPDGFPALARERRRTRRQDPPAARPIPSAPGPSDRPEFGLD